MKSATQILFILIAIFITQVSWAGKVVVIVNENNAQTISPGDIKAIYSDHIIQWADGSEIKSYDLPVKDASREVFSQNVLGTSARDVAKTWANRKITNTAKNPPKTKKEKLVVLLVKKKMNAIGYVSEKAIAGKSGIKVVMEID
jgi:hypothetical protein